MKYKLIMVISLTVLYCCEMEKISDQHHDDYWVIWLPPLIKYVDENTKIISNEESDKMFKVTFIDCKLHLSWETGIYTTCFYEFESKKDFNFEWEKIYNYPPVTQWIKVYDSMGNIVTENVFGADHIPQKGDKILIDLKFSVIDPKAARIVIEKPRCPVDCSKVYFE